MKRSLVIAAVLFAAVLSPARANDVDVVIEYRYDSDGNKIGASYYAANRTNHYVCVTPYLDRSENVNGDLHGGRRTISQNSRDYIGSYSLRSYDDEYWVADVGVRWTDGICR